jgi:hypothetical protein
MERLKDYEMDFHHSCMMSLRKNGKERNYIKKEKVMQKGV